VIIMSVAAALFFLAADWVFSTLVTIIFGLGR
jgi:preprotein translocase subunit SecE